MLLPIHLLAAALDKHIDRRRRKPVTLSAPCLSPACLASGQREQADRKCGEHTNRRQPSSTIHIRIAAGLKRVLAQPVAGSTNQGVTRVHTGSVSHGYNLSECTPWGAPRMVNKIDGMHNGSLYPHLSVYFLSLSPREPGSLSPTRVPASGRPN